MEILTERMILLEEQIGSVEQKVYHLEVSEANELKALIDSCILEFPNWYFGYLSLAEFIIADSRIKNMFILVVDYEAAQPLYSKAVELAPFNPIPYFARAELRTEVLDYEGAFADYQKAFELAPDSQTVCESYAFFLSFHTQKHEFAIPIYSKLIDLNPENASYYASRAALKNTIKDFFGALTDYTKAIEIDTKQGHYFFGRAIAKKETNDLIGALQDFTIAITFRSDEQGFKERGKVKELLGDVEGAAEDYKKAKELELPF